MSDFVGVGIVLCDCALVAGTQSPSARAALNKMTKRVCMSRCMKCSISGRHRQYRDWIFDGLGIPENKGTMMRRVFSDAEVNRVTGGYWKPGVSFTDLAKLLIPRWDSCIKDSRTRPLPESLKLFPASGINSQT